jgi:hypothetical protein
MGLRIIGRGPRLTPREATLAEHEAALEDVTREWLLLRRATDEDEKALFLARLKRVRAALDRQGAIADVVGRVQADLSAHKDDGASPHNEVDVATLLSLL